MRQEALKPHEIRWLRRTMGQTQTQFGTFFGRDAATIFRWENGHYEPDPGSQAALLMIWEDVRRELEEKGINPDELRPSIKLPDGWQDFVGRIIIAGIFIYLLSKLSSD